MRKMIVLVCVLTVLSFGIAIPADATVVGGTGGAIEIGSVTNSTTSVNTSNNVFLNYTPVSGTSGQSYGASTKHRAGDRYFGTAGGGTALSNVFWLQSSVGDIAPPDCSTDLGVGSVGSWVAM